jgi:hypothetical protein
VTPGLTHPGAAQLAGPSVSGMMGSARGNGIANLLKYALNLDPRAASPAGLPSLGQADRFLTLAHTQRKSRLIC